MNDQTRLRNTLAVKLFKQFLDVHCPSCRRARREKKPGRRAKMASCTKCGPETGHVFARFLDVWRPELETYAQTRRLDAVGPQIDWEDLVSEFGVALAKAWYTGFTPGKGDLVHYMWRAVHNAWVRMVNGAFRKRNTIERERTPGDTGKYRFGVPAASVTSPLDDCDAGGETFAEKLADRSATDPGDGDRALAAELRDRIIGMLTPFEQAVFWDMLVNERLDARALAEEHRVTIQVVEQRLEHVRLIASGIAHEYRDRRVR